MNTRQIRISDPEQIKDRINDFTGKKINVVLRDGMVFLGQLLKTTDTTITLLNSRNKRMTFGVPAIAELFIDLTV